jgi:hypothetical protein
MKRIMHTEWYSRCVFTLISIELSMVLLDNLYELIYKTSCPRVYVPYAVEAVIPAVPVISYVCLSLFLVEIGVMMFIYRLRFFTHISHVVDAVIITVSFVFETIILIHLDDDDRMTTIMSQPVLMVFRMWRIVRLIHGVVERVRHVHAAEKAKLEAYIEVLLREKRQQAMRERGESE